MWKTLILLLNICLVLNFQYISGEILKGVTIRNRPYAELKNGKIEGFANDLMGEISALSGFDYTLEFQPDNIYGVVSNGSINGMLGQVYNDRADFAISDITVTDARKGYVEFTEPFIETKISILIHKDNVNGMNTFKDLSEQTDVKYGAVLMGSTYHMFSQSTDPVLQKLYRQMTNNPGDLVTNLRKGVERVKASEFGLFVEKSFAEYITGIDCELTIIDDPNNYFPGQFSIALNKQSNYTEKFNSAIRQLKAAGRIDKLRNRYWKKCGLLTGVTVISPPFTELVDGKLEGIAMDLIKEISTISGFKYDIELKTDGTYGLIKNGTMVGMIGDVYYNRVDFAVADLTVTDNRKEYVDFTDPFIETGLVILIRKDIANGINSINDLAEQTAINYGIVFGGSTWKFFSESNHSAIQKMFQKINESPDFSTERIQTGIEKVRSTPFAFIVEKPFAEYITGKDCQLTYIEDQDVLPSIQFALAVKKGSKNLDKFNLAIRLLKSNGQIDLLRNRYWKKCGFLSGVTIRRWPLADVLFDKIEGFVVDIMNEISTISGFNYSLYFTPDKKYGNIDSDNRINGMVGEVHRNRADFAIADLTITDVRQQFVDFTEPFMETGIAILIDKNYANNISSFADLSEQSYISYGIIRTGSTYLFFNQSTDPIIQILFTRMTENPEVFVENFQTGLFRVKTTPFALIVEKSAAELIIGKDCSVTFVGDQNNYDRRQFGIALPKSSEYLEKFNSAIRQLKSSGRINAIRNRHWKKCGVLTGVTIASKPYVQLIDGQFSGFAIDLMNEISNLKGINYTLDLAPDGRYGLIVNNIPNGMIGEIYKNMADFAVADITVTEERENYVDFTEPFIVTGLAILLRKELATNISSFSDLVGQSLVKYGTISSGSTYKLFANSTDSTFSEMFRVMSEEPDVFVSNYSVGIERVNTTPFAFIAEKAFAEYMTGENCQLTYIEDPEHWLPRLYAIAVPKNSEYLEVFSSAIIEMKTNGELNRLREKYWKKCLE